MYSLTQEEKPLHHWAAMLSKKLEEYYACKSRDEKAQIEEEFKMHLVYSYLFNHCSELTYVYFGENQWTILLTL